MKQTKTNGCGKVVEFKNYSKKCGFSYDDGVFFCKKCKKENRPEHGYWIIPPEIYNPLHKEFNFQFDPCPNPRPKDFDGLQVDWKKSNWVNPPFWAGITGWVRKAISEQEKGKTSVLILPLDNWVNLLIKSGAELRAVGSHDWIHTKDGSRRKAPRPSILFILRPKTAREFHSTETHN